MAGALFCANRSAQHMQDFEGINRKELSKIKAYMNYKARGIKLSSKEQEAEDWTSALEEVKSGSLTLFIWYLLRESEGHTGASESGGPQDRQLFVC